MKLTSKTAANLALPDGRNEAIFFDELIPGFGLRVRAGGSRVWVFQYKFGIRHRRMTLGRVSAVDAVKARHMASELYAKVRLGGDPAGDKAGAHMAASNTFGALAKRYLAFQETRLRPSSLISVRHYLKRAAPLNVLRVDKIERRTVAELLSTEAQRGDVAANRLRGVLSATFAWGVGEGLCDANPVIGTTRRVERPRERVLPLAELAAIWRACGEDDYGLVVRMLALTGQRRSEIAGLRWDEVDTDAGFIRLPAERVKNHRPHSIPLSPAALAILVARPRDSVFVFGTGRRSYCSWIQPRAKLDARLAEAGAALAPWVLHDLRRSVATGLADAGVAPHIVEQILNHQSGHRAGVAGTYNKSRYEAEARAAMVLWQEHVLAVVEDREARVVPLRA